MKGNERQPATWPQRQLLEKLEAICNCADPAAEGLELLAELIQGIRPYTYLNARFAQSQLQLLTDTLRSDPAALAGFRRLLAAVFAGADVTEVMTASGINSEHNFFREVSKRLRHKILPQLHRRGSLLHAVGILFHRKNDHLWVEAVDPQVWIDLFAISGFESSISNRRTRHQFYHALCVTSSRISALAVEPDVQRCLDEEEQLLFVRQNRTALEIVERHDARPLGLGLPRRTESLRLDGELQQCEAVLQRIRENIGCYGTSLHQTYVVLRIRQLIERMRMILEILDGDEQLDMGHVAGHFITIVRNENTRNSLRSLVRDNVELLAYRIAEHERNTGEHYITSTRGEFRRMFRSAMGGGAIVSLVAIVKSLLHALRAAPFWQGFLYSMNYSAGFITIYATGATLATKQPAMTASAIASSLDNKKSDAPNMPELAILIARVTRSQFASFAGNLLVVFPLTVAIAWAWQQLFGTPLAAGEHAQAMLDEQNPLRSLSLLYACFTGVFLFLSGIISGYFDNMAVYGNIPDRLRQHPRLKNTFSPRTLDRIADYTGKHLGGIMGNLCLGFFLGMAGFVGATFGIPFDIRHITISTANFAIGLQGLGFQAPVGELIWVTAGVILIGFLNFLVSFSLAFFTALASRKVRFRHYRRFARYLTRLIIRYPLDFVRPPKHLRKPEDFMRHRK